MIVLDNIKKAGIKFIIVLILTLFFIHTLSETTYADRRDALLGVWVGSFGNEPRSGLKMLIYQVEGPVGYQATLLFYNNPNRTRLIAHYLADVRFNASANRFEISYIHTYFRPATWYDAATLSGTISSNVFSGNTLGGRPWSLTRIASSEHILTEPHIHRAGDTSWLLTAATCNMAGIRIFSCIFCRAEARRETIPVLPHTPTGNWVILRESSCLEAGQRVQYCDDCGEIALSEEISRIPHVPTGEWVVIESPSLSEAGMRVIYCSECNEEVNRESISALADRQGIAYLLIVMGVIILAVLIFIVYRRIK